MLQRYSVGLFVLGTTGILFFQNCGGGFNSYDMSSVAKASSGIAMNSSSIVMSAESTTLLSNSQISFIMTGLPQGGKVSWSNTLNQNSPCVSVTSAVANQYTLICPLAGSLVVNGLVTASGSNPLFLTDTYHLGTGPSGPLSPGAPTPTPAPTPKPATGQLLADQQVYTANCARCHGDVEYSSKRGTTRFNTDVAISNNVGQMGQLSGLSSAERDEIIFALNNIQP